MSHEALTDYFSRINQPATKEATMFTKLKQYWTDKFSFTEEPSIDKYQTYPPTLNEDEEENGYWVFEMFTPEWYDEAGELNKTLHTVHREPHEGTWMGVLDTILDKMEAHYGYDIKSQVYYSVTFPLNIEGEAGYGRCLNDEVLQQLLLSYPEAYEVHPSMSFLKDKQ